MKNEATISRRDLLKLGATAAVGMTLGASGFGVFSGATTVSGKKDAKTILPFYGDHQTGIITDNQSNFVFAAFDIQTESIGEIRDLFQQWTSICEQITAGKMLGNNEEPKLPPDDTGEAEDLSPSRLTITFGFGPDFFRKLGSPVPAGLVEIPSMPGDQLQEERSGGDIGVFVGADDPQVAFYAVRNLARNAHGTASIRWIQKGFTSGPKGETPRNLFGFKDGTANMSVRDKDSMNQYVWVNGGNRPSWMQGGSYMAVRRIQMHTEVWDRLALRDQEDTFGRVKSTGAPIGKSKELDSVSIDLLPERSHVRLVKEVKTQILRRGYSYMDGLDPKTGRMDTGLFFVSFQQDLNKQFIPMLAKLMASDRLNEYTTHVSNAVFACPRGFRKGKSILDGVI